MENFSWTSFKNGIREHLNFIIELDQRSLAIVTEGWMLMWQDIRTFFAA